METILEFRGSGNAVYAPDIMAFYQRLKYFTTSIPSDAKSRAFVYMATRQFNHSGPVHFCLILSPVVCYSHRAEFRN
jgi:hypothetical protein